jgi:hypothetical protein
MRPIWHRFASAFASRFGATRRCGELGTSHEPRKNGGKKARPHPNLLPQEKESLFQRLVNLSALRLRLVQGFKARNFLRKIFSRSRG